MKTLLSTLTILLISGCGDPAPSLPTPCTEQECKFPELPTYKIPAAKGMTKPVDLGNGLYAVVGSELKECLITSKLMRKRCENYAYVNSKTNERYQKPEPELGKEI